MTSRSIKRGLNSSCLTCNWSIDVECRDSTWGLPIVCGSPFEAAASVVIRIHGVAAWVRSRHSLNVGAAP